MVTNNRWTKQMVTNKPVTVTTVTNNGGRTTGDEHSSYGMDRLHKIGMTSVESEKLLTHMVPAFYITKERNSHSERKIINGKHRMVVPHQEIQRTDITQYNEQANEQLYTLPILCTNPLKGTMNTSPTSGGQLLKEAAVFGPQSGKATRRTPRWAPKCPTQSATRGICVSSISVVQVQPHSFDLDTMHTSMQLTNTSLFCLTVWGTWGPIVESALVAFPDWGPNTAASFSNWPPLVGLVFMVPLRRIAWTRHGTIIITATPYHHHFAGLRKGILLSAGFLVAGTTIRCFPVDDLTFTVLCHVGAFMVGVSCCLLMPQVGAVVSAWFSPAEGTTAIAVALLMNQLGGVTMYFSPLVVRAPVEEDLLPEDIRKDITILMYIHFGMSLLLFLCVLFYFPDAPPSPPSPSSKEEREDFGKGLKDFLRNPHLILIVVAYGVSFGVVGNWVGFMTYSLLEIGIHQEEAMGVGISSVVGASVSAFVAARLTDRIYGHLKVTIIGLLAASFAFFLWFFFLSTGVVEATLG
nr:disrupted in renal carcinoma protein 2 homolog [Penaeus vannamei]